MITELNRVRGAAGSAERSAPTLRSAFRAVRRTSRANLKGWVALLNPARASSSNALGTLQAPTGSSTAGTGASGVRSWMAAVISAPDTPSMAAWWTLLTSAKDPGGTPSTLSRPSMT